MDPLETGNGNVAAVGLSPGPWGCPHSTGRCHRQPIDAPARGDELDAALRHAKERDPAFDLASSTVDDFPLSTFTAEIDNLRRVLVDGCGVFAYTGVPVDRYDDDELRALWWGLRSSIGTPVSQSWRGDVIGDVRDIGTGVTGRAGRGYTSNAELSFHCDTADVTEQQIEAVEYVAAVAAEPQMWVERRFEAGTMWFVNNQTVFHTA